MPWQPVDPREYASSVTELVPEPDVVFATPGYAQPPPQKNPLATASLVLGLIGIVFPLLSVGAIVFGHIAGSNGRRAGRSSARAGCGLGYLSILAWGVTILITSGILFI